MVIFDSQTYCNTFSMISGTSKKSSKYGPSDPVFITKIFQTLQENILEHPWTYYLSYPTIWNSEHGGRSVHLAFVFRNSELFIFKCLSFEIKEFGDFVFEFMFLMFWNFGTLELWICDILKSCKVEDGYREMMKILVNNALKSLTWISDLSKNMKLQFW